MVTPSMCVMIPIQSKVTNLGMTIHTSLNEIVKDNYETILGNIQSDLVRWSALPASLQSRIAAIKMNVLPHINLLSAMIPLPPPMTFWKRFNYLIPNAYRIINNLG